MELMEQGKIKEAQCIKILVQALSIKISQSIIMATTNQIDRAQQIKTNSKTMDKVGPTFSFVEITMTHSIKCTTSQTHNWGWTVSPSKIHQWTSIIKSSTNSNSKINRIFSSRTTCSFRKNPQRTSVYRSAILQLPEIHLSTEIVIKVIELIEMVCKQTSPRTQVIFKLLNHPFLMPNLFFN